ncbi:MAG: SPFH domain-containing protein [Ignavibacteriae bacterium]|nr:SPFH domain-containing protein [Ignavibacteriota bacterium]
MDQITEREARRISGYVAAFTILLLIVSDVLLFRWIALNDEPVLLWVEIPLLLLTVFSFFGFLVVQPNEARVLVLFGKYIGSIRKDGFWWANPFAVKRHISLRIRNFNSEKIKVNDFHGNPIEIAAVVVWRVVDSARAMFDVQNFEDFVAIQSETALRGLSSQYPYDAQDEAMLSLRGNPIQIVDHLKQELETRLAVAGVEVIESRISHLAYAPEIAQAMLRRQQAQAIIAARRKIVEGAVGMVDDALRMLSEQKIVQLDEEKKATMVNNLMVALVSDNDVQPIINTGTLYQ